MQAFRYFLLISMIVHSATLWFHHHHGLLHGDLWLGIGLCVLGYGCLLGLSKRLWIAGLAFSSTILFLVLQHGFLDLRLQGWQGSQATSEEGIWVLFIFLFIPLIFLAWYNKRNLVITYLFVSALADLGLGLWLQPHFAQYLPIVLKAVLWRTAAFLVAGISLSHLLGRLRQANQTIQTQALASAQLSESRERNRISRELHDTLAHSLSALAVQLEAIDATWDDSHDQNRARITQALATTRQGLAETRRAIQNLQAHPLESLGLSEALRQCAVQASQRGSFLLLDRIDNSTASLPDSIAHGFLRIGQEALENVVRHAHAQNVTVEFQQSEKEINLRVSDDGIGFKLQDSSTGHFGIAGMRERATLMNAQFSLQTQTSLGSTVELRWSLAP